jgi:hypothetical protein
MNTPLYCPYCHQLFVPSPFRPQQRVCSGVDCQRRRKTEYHRQARQNDPAYALVCRDSQVKWRAAHRDYHRLWRQAHPQAVDANRKCQRQRDTRRRIRHLVKNNLAFQVKPFPAEVWLLGQKGEDLAKNNLAVSQVVIFQEIAATTPHLAPS